MRVLALLAVASLLDPWWQLSSQHPSLPRRAGVYAEPVNASSTFIALDAGPGQHACALTADGAAWCIG